MLQVVDVLNRWSKNETREHNADTIRWFIFLHVFPNGNLTKFLSCTITDIRILSFACLLDGDLRTSGKAVGRTFTELYSSVLKTWSLSSSGVPRVNALMLPVTEMCLTFLWYLVADSRSSVFLSNSVAWLIFRGEDNIYPLTDGSKKNLSKSTFSGLSKSGAATWTT